MTLKTSPFSTPSNSKENPLDFDGLKEKVVAAEWTKIFNK